MDRKLKDKRDAGRFRAAVRRGLDLGKVLEVIFGGREEALSGKKVGALGALGRLERALKNGHIKAKVKGRKYLPLSILKGLVGEGYLRPERIELLPHQKHKEAKKSPDPRLVGTVYLLTRKGEKLLEKGGGTKGVLETKTPEASCPEKGKKEKRQGQEKLSEDTPADNKPE
jgi:hypothetical protein